MRSPTAPIEAAVRRLGLARWRRAPGPPRRLSPFESGDDERFPVDERHLVELAGSAFYWQPLRMTAGMWRLIIGPSTVAVALPVPERLDA